MYLISFKDMIKKNKKSVIGFIDRDKPITWIVAIIIAMLILPLTVTLILYYGMQ